MTPIEQYLKAFLRPSRVRVDTPPYTKYRSFILIRLQPRHTGKFPHQRVLEHYRPHVDYIILPTHYLLVGFSSEYKELARAAIELSTEYVAKQQAQVLSAYQHLHSICLLYKDGTSYANKFPEQFI